jgi:hypothetical protein
VSTALTFPVAEAAVETLTTPLHLVDAAAVTGVSEETRWMIGFGVPCLFAGLFVAAAIGTGISWFLAPALASLGAAILALTWLAISSDTNA